MSNFFNDLGTAFRKVANDVSTEVTIASREQRLKEAYLALGKLHYQAAKKGESLESPRIAAQMESISLLIQEIRTMRDSRNIPTEDDFADEA